MEKTNAKASPMLMLLLIAGAAAQRTVITPGTTPSGSSQRILICDFIDVTGTKFDVQNPVFYLNGSDVLLRLTGVQYTENAETGVLTFEITQELEGYYTCDNISDHVPLSLDPVPVVGK